MKYYKGNWKYIAAEDEWIDTPITGIEFDVKFIKLTLKGRLLVRAGYAWDGASGPAIDTKTNMRGSKFHDALYQSLRLSLLPPWVRVLSDMVYRDICLEDGMWKWRANWEYVGIKKGAGYAADPKRARKVYEAP